MDNDEPLMAYRARLEWSLRCLLLAADEERGAWFNPGPLASALQLHLHTQQAYIEYVLRQTSARLGVQQQEEDPEQQRQSFLTECFQGADLRYYDPISEENKTVPISPSAQNRVGPSL